MLWSMKELFGYNVHASDGESGKLHDFYIDKRSWIIHYSVIDIGDWILDTGDWTPGRQVIISPEVFRPPDAETRLFSTALLKAEIENIPEADLEQLNRKSQRAEEVNSSDLPLHRLGGGLFEADKIGMHPDSIIETIRARQQEKAETLSRRFSNAQHLLSAKALLKYQIQAGDGQIGQVEDCLVDVETWSIHFLLIKTGKWLLGKKVVIAPAWVQQIVFQESRIYVGLPQSVIKNGPQVDPVALLNYEPQRQLKATEKHA